MGKFKNEKDKMDEKLSALAALIYNNGNGPTLDEITKSLNDSGIGIANHLSKSFLQLLSPNLNVRPK